MVPERHDIREFRRLRRRLIDLSGYISAEGAVNRLNSSASMGDFLRVREYEEEAAEIRYVLEYFASLRAQWSGRAQIFFTVGITVIIVLAMLAAYRL